MIQRIQSVWLFVASALAFMLLKLSFYTGTHLPDNQYDQLTGTDTLLLMITTIALGVYLVNYGYRRQHREKEIKNNTTTTPVMQRTAQADS